MKRTLFNLRFMAKRRCRVFPLLLAWWALLAPAYPQAPNPVDNTALTTAITRHGAEAVRAVTRIRLEGQSASLRGTTRVVLFADLSGNSRIDYGDPVTRSIINTPAGTTVIQNGRSSRKPGHVGAFAQLDLFSIFGLLRLETGNVAWSDLGPVTIAGRPANSLRATTGTSKQQYHRTLPDQIDIRFDQETGLVSSMTRMHYAEKSLDLARPVTFLFADHRVINEVSFPFRMDLYVNATLMETITVAKVEWNPALPPGVFER